MSKLAFSSLAMLLLFCAPVLAQSSPSATQYEPCPSNSPACVSSSLDNSVEDVVDNAEQGTSAVNGAMDEAMSGAVHGTVEASSAGASDVNASAAASSARSPSAENESGGEGTAVGPGGITKLPETGGASPAVLGSGFVLVALGLMIRKAAGR